MAERSFGPVVVRRRLGSELRRLRERAGMSLEQAARELEVSPSKISRLETGQSAAKVWDVRNLLTLYGVDDEDYRRRAERWVNEGRSVGWWHPYSDAVSSDMEHYISLEAEAVELRSYCAPYLYGLLQTEDYADVLIRATQPGLEDAIVRNLIGVRLGRKRILEADDPPEVHVIVDESVLWRPVGDRGIMLTQWKHLLDIAQRIDLRVRPFAAAPHVALFSPFTIFFPREKSTDRIVVNLESAYHDAYFDDESGVSQFTRSFEDLHRSALTPEESADLVRRLVHEGPPTER